MIKEKFFLGFIRFMTFLSVAIIASIFIFLSVKAIGIINLNFIFSKPENAMTEGGIFPAIVGSFYLVVLSVLFAIPPGIATAIYLSEYSSNSKIKMFIKTSINTLAGIPSVVFGLFGLSIFVKMFGFGISLLSGSLTLSVVILPLFISATREALISVHYSLREASMALGATKWETIKNVVLPAAAPSIFTAIILSIGRVAGETAPILFTAAVFYQKNLPDSLFSPVMALPYHIYALITEGTHPEKQIPIAYGTAFILFILVIFVSLLAIIMREKRRRYDKVRN